MKFALVDSVRSEAQPDLKGICPHCNNQMIPKCGPVKINHWAHVRRKKGDCKWETETPWHRAWKDEFPADWQEYSQRDALGEMHIADVFVPGGLAIEIQHSLISREEVIARTNFYRKICWIVDGQRLKTGWKKFRRALWIGYMRTIDNVEIHKTSSGNSHLLMDWGGLKALVVFDFGSHGLWVTDHNNVRGYTYAYKIDKQQFIELLKLGKRPSPCQTFDHRPEPPPW